MEVLNFGANILISRAHLSDHVGEVEDVHWRYSLLGRPMRQVTIVESVHQWSKVLGKPLGQLCQAINNFSNFTFKIRDSFDFVDVNTRSLPLLTIFPLQNLLSEDRLTLFLRGLSYETSWRRRKALFNVLLRRLWKETVVKFYWSSLRSLASFWPWKNSLWTLVKQYS